MRFNLNRISNISKRPTRVQKEARQKAWVGRTVRWIGGNEQNINSFPGKHSRFVEGFTEGVREQNLRFTEGVREQNVRHDVGADHQRRLREARNETLAFLSLHISEKDPSWIKYVMPAAQHLLSVLDQLSQDAHFWNELKHAEVAIASITKDEVRWLQETVDSDLAGILDFMNYTPPPPSAELASELQLSLHDVLSQPDRAARAGLTRDAERSLSFYTFRLRRLMNEVAAASSSNSDNHATRRRLISALSKGATAAAPGVIATGIATAMFPPAGVPGFVGALGLGASEATKELTKNGVQLAATGLIAKLLADEKTMADPVTARLVAWVQFHEAAADMVSSLDDLLQKNEHIYKLPNAVRAVGIEATRAAYEILRAQTTVNDGRDALVEPPVMDALHALRDLRDWEETSQSRRELLKITNDFIEAVSNIHQKLS
jgi:hypothetical protein